MTDLEQAVMDKKLSAGTKAVYLAAVRSYLRHVNTTDPSRWTQRTIDCWLQHLKRTKRAQTVVQYFKALNSVLQQVPTAGSMDQVAIAAERVLRSIPVPGSPIDKRDAAVLALWTCTGLPAQAICLLQLPNLTGLEGVTFSTVARWASWLQDRGFNTGPLFPPLSKPHINGNPQPRQGSITPGAVLKILQSRIKKAGVKLVPNDLHGALALKILDSSSGT